MIEFYRISVHSIKDYNTAWSNACDAVMAFSVTVDSIIPDSMISLPFRVLETIMKFICFNNHK